MRRKGKLLADKEGGRMGLRKGSPVDKRKWSWIRLRDLAYERGWTFRNK